MTAHMSVWRGVRPRQPQCSTSAPTRNVRTKESGSRPTDILTGPLRPINMETGYANEPRVVMPPNRHGRSMLRANKGLSFRAYGILLRRRRRLARDRDARARRTLENNEPFRLPGAPALLLAKLASRNRPGLPLACPGCDGSSAHLRSQTFAHSLVPQRSGRGAARSMPVMRSTDMTRRSTGFKRKARGD